MHIERPCARLGPLLAAALLVGGPILADPATPLTLDEAVRRGLAESPAIARARAEVASARAALTTARTYPHNPRLEVEAGRRRGEAGTSTDRGVRLSQEVEMAGQRRRRTAAAEAGLEAADAALHRVRLEVVAAVEDAWVAVLAAEELLDVAQADRRLTDHLLAFEERRLEAGAGTQIRLNLARAASGRAVRAVQRARAEVVRERAALATALGMPPHRLPPVEGPLPIVAPGTPPVADLVEHALATRGDLAAAGHRLERARRSVALERSLALPNLEVGATVRREEGDEIAGGNLGVSIPLFDRNRGGIARARAALDAATADRTAADLRVREEVTAAHGRLRAAAAAVEALRSLVVSSLDESLSLLQRSLQAGKVSATDVLVLRRELVDGRREAVDASRELGRARTALALATGDPSYLLSRTIVPGTAQGTAPSAESTPPDPR